MTGLAGLADWIEPTAGLACVLCAALCWGLYRHTKECSESRRRLYEAIDRNTQAVNALAERVSALEAVSNMNSIQEIAKIAKGL